MSITTYKALTIILLGMGWIAFLASIGFFLGALVGWRTPFRKRRFSYAGGLFIVAIGTVAAQQALLWWVFMPSLASERQAQSDARVAEQSFTRVGDVAPELSLVTDDATSVDSTGLRGKVVVLNFFATWCGPCIKELPHLQTLWEEFGKRDDFSMLIVGREETRETVAEFKSKRGFSFPIAADPERATYSRYASTMIPRTYLISRDGKIAFQSVGFHEEEIAELRKLIAKELNSSR